MTYERKKKFVLAHLVDNGYHTHIDERILGKDHDR